MEKVIKAPYMGSRNINLQTKEYVELQVLSEMLDGKPMVQIIRELVAKEAKAHGIKVVVTDKPKRGRPFVNKEA